MSQALIVNSVRRSRHVVVTWFGNCSYRRLKVTYEVRKMVCPLCLHELEDDCYFGNKAFALDKNAIDYVRDSWLSLLEDGREVWVVSHRG
jgi:hypothetical protein